MKREQVTDMTKGPVFRQMAAFALPVLLGMIFQRIYNFADAYIVGRYLGDGALAAVSIAGTAMYMMTSIMQGVTTGVSIVISQFYGGGENRKLRKTFAAGIHVALWITVLITVTGVTTADPLLRLLQTGSELLPDARIYLIVIYGGCGATMLYNFASSVLRALGNSLVPLAFLVVSSVMNVILDIALVSWIPVGGGRSGSCHGNISAFFRNVMSCICALDTSCAENLTQRVETGSLSGRADSQIRDSYRSSDEYYFDFRYDAPGCCQYIQHCDGGGLWSSA